MKVVLAEDLDPFDGDEAALVVVEIARSEIERHHFAPTLDKLRGLTDTPERVKKYRDSVAFMVAGYDDDPRELFEIPEVRTFFQSVTIEWPHWLWFLTREENANQLGMLFSLLCGAQWVDPADKSKRYFVNERALALQVEDMLMRGDVLFTTNGITVEEKRTSLDTAMKALGMTKSSV